MINSMQSIKIFFSKTSFVDNGCVEWVGSKNKKGYGLFNYNSKYEYAHRFSYRKANGLTKIPDKMYVCHSCDNPSCINPDHLWLGTHADNMKDCVKKGRHHNKTLRNCPKGHPYSGGNLYIRPNGVRECRECSRESYRKWYYKNKEESK